MGSKSQLANIYGTYLSLSRLSEIQDGAPASCICAIFKSVVHKAMIHSWQTETSAFGLK